MSHLDPSEDFSAIETIWQKCGPSSSEGLEASWLAAMRAELIIQRHRVDNRFVWAVAAALLLGCHLALAVGWSSSLACASTPTDGQVAGTITPLAWQAVLIDLENGDRHSLPESF